MKKKKCNIRHVIIALLFLSSYLSCTGQESGRLYRFIDQADQSALIHIDVISDSGKSAVPRIQIHTHGKSPPSPSLSGQKPGGNIGSIKKNSTGVLSLSILFRQTVILLLFKVIRYYQTIWLICSVTSFNSFSRTACARRS